MRIQIIARGIILRESTTTLGNRTSCKAFLERVSWNGSLNIRGGDIDNSGAETTFEILIKDDGQTE